MRGLMPFENGSFACSIFSASKPLPKQNEVLELLSAYKAKRLDELGEEPQYGWCGWRHLLEIELDESSVILGRYPFFQLRTAVRTVPASLLKSECRMYEQNYLRETKFERVPQKKKKEIREEVMRRRLPAMPPSLSGVQIVMDTMHQMLYLSTSSTKQQQLFVQLFQKTFDIELQVVNVAELMFRKMKRAAIDLPPLKLEKGVEETDFPGRDFLTWLWYFSESKEGKLFVIDKGAPVQLTLDGPLLMTAAFEGNGSGETQIKKGLPTQSLEVKSALQVGKKLKKAKIMLAKEEAWTFSFDADKFSFAGIVLPEGEQMDSNGRFDDRMERLYVLVTIFETYFEKYANVMLNEIERKKLEKAMDTWIETRVGF